MEERFEFRIPIRSAGYLSPGVGRVDDDVVVVSCFRDDAIFKAIKQANARAQGLGDGMAFAGWDIQREYTKSELDRADLFSVMVCKVFEPCGEECGTEYDESAACTFEIEPIEVVEVGGHKVEMGPMVCGAGSRQLTALRLRAASIPRGFDFAKTIADEIVVSQRAVDVIRHAGLTGVDFSEIVCLGRGRRPTTRYYQPIFVGPAVDVHSDTKAGESPFDSSAYGRCPHGHTIGLNLLSELCVVGPIGDAVDFLVTRQLLGSRVGLLRPSPILLVSSKARSVFLKEGLIGLEFGIVRVR